MFKNAYNFLLIGNPVEFVIYYDYSFCILESIDAEANTL